MPTPPTTRPRTPSPWRAVVAVALAVGLAHAPTPAAAATPERTPDEQFDMLVSLLRATEIPLNRRSLDTVGRDINLVLVRIADLPRVDDVVRVRAVAALGLYPSRMTLDYLSSLLHERSLIGTALGTRLRRQAVRSIGVGFGDRAPDLVLALQRDPEPRIREAVAHAIGDSGSTHAIAALNAWLPNEPVLTVRLAIDSAIDTLRGR